MDFPGTFRSILEKFKEDQIDYALIGGLALSFWGYPRATHDLDFMVLAKKKEIARKGMEELGFKVLRETENVAQYERGSDRVAFIYAVRVHGLKVLERACEKEFFGLKFKVACPEDIIGLKVQSLANNPLRWFKEMADIETLLVENRGRLDLELVGQYFKLFNLEKDWKSLLERYHANRE